MLNRSASFCRRLLFLQRTLEALDRAELTLKKCHSDILANRDHLQIRCQIYVMRSERSSQQLIPRSSPAVSRIGRAAPNDDGCIVRALECWLAKNSSG
jgi:hypothetical protein